MRSFTFFLPICLCIKRTSLDATECLFLRQKPQLCWQTRFLAVQRKYLNSVAPACVIDIALYDIRDMSTSFTKLGYGESIFPDLQFHFFSFNGWYIKMDGKIVIGEITRKNNDTIHINCATFFRLAYASECLVTI